MLGSEVLWGKGAQLQVETASSVLSSWDLYTFWGRGEFDGWLKVPRGPSRFHLSLTFFRYHSGERKSCLLSPSRFSFCPAQELSWVGKMFTLGTLTSDLESHRF